MVQRVSRIWLNASLPWTKKAEYLKTCIVLIFMCGCCSCFTCRIKHCSSSITAFWNIENISVHSLLFPYLIYCGLTFFFKHLKFKETNLVMLQQFNALAQMHRIEQLTVDPQGNPVVNFSLWKYYVLFRLNHFNLQKINGVKVG